MYHNVRDKFGRFSKKKTTRKAKTSRVAKAIKTILSVFLLDDSGSMMGKTYVTISGFNEVLNSGQRDAHQNKVNLHEVLIKFGLPGNETLINGVRELTPLSYQPSQGRTALWDAVGFAIKNIEELLLKLPKDTAVLLNIFTDGEENASRIWNLGTINARIKQKQDEGWTITFIGAGDKASVQKVAHDAGIYASNTMNYTNNVAGTQSAFASVVAARSSYTKNVAKGKVVKDGFFGK